MKADKISINYAIKVTNEEFLKIMEKDDSWKGEVESSPTLCELLENADAERVEYNGMFGAFVFVTCTDDEIDGLIKMVRDYIKS